MYPDAPVAPLVEEEEAEVPLAPVPYLMPEPELTPLEVAPLVTLL